MEIFSTESLGPTHIPTLKNLSGVRWSKEGPIIPFQTAVLSKIDLVSPFPVYVGPKRVQLFSVSTLGSPSVRAQQVVDTSMLNLCKLFNFTLMYQYCRRICHHPTCHLAVLNKEIGDRDLLEVFVGVSLIKTELSNYFVLFIKDIFILWFFDQVSTTNRSKF